MDFLHTFRVDLFVNPI